MIVVQFRCDLDGPKQRFFVRAESELKAESRVGSICRDRFNAGPGEYYLQTFLVKPLTPGIYMMPSF